MVWHVAGVDLTVRSADQVREVGAGSVGVTALLASLAGIGTIRLLAKRATGLRHVDDRGRRGLDCLDARSDRCHHTLSGP